MSHQLSKNINPADHIYYDVKFNNIYVDNEDSVLFDVTENSSVILEHQNDYRMAVSSFRLDLDIPFCVMPIKQGFVPFSPAITLNSITNANPAVFTTSAPTGCILDEAIKITGALGMPINGTYFINSILSPTSFTLKYQNGSTVSGLVNTAFYPPHTPGTGEVQLLNDNYNLTQWGICLRHAGVDYAEPIIYIPDKNISADPSFIPKTPRYNQGLQDYSTFYYYTYSNAVILQAINNALSDATNRVNLAVPGTLVSPPQFIYENDKFSLIIDNRMITNSVSLFANALMMNYFEGFRVQAQLYNSANYKDLLFIFTNQLNVNAYAPNGQTVPAYPANPPEYLKFTQEWPSLYRFNSIVSVLLLSSQLQIRKEWFPRLQQFNSVSSLGRGTISNNTGALAIISSFDLEDDGNTVSWRQVQHYEPSFYKYIDLISSEPLNKIDITVYFLLDNDTLIPAYVPVNSANNIKLYFEKKY